WTRRAEELGRAPERSGLQLAYALRRRKPAEVERAEIGRGEIGDVELELYVVIGPPCVRSHPPASCVPRAELVAYVHHHRVVGRVRAAGQSSVEINESKPETFGHAELEAPGVGDHQKERRPRVVPALDPLDEVDPEQETPELPLGGVRRCAGLHHFYLALREPLLPVELDAIEGVADRLRVELEHRIELRPGATAPVFRVCKSVQVPEL